MYQGDRKPIFSHNLEFRTKTVYFKGVLMAHKRSGSKLTSICSTCYIMVVLYLFLLS